MSRCDALGATFLFLWGPSWRRPGHPSERRIFSKFRPTWAATYYAFRGFASIPQERSGNARFLLCKGKTAGKRSFPPFGWG